LSKSEELITLTELKKYVAEKVANPRVYFYGIFLKNTLEHIGNIKYEKEVKSKKYFMGILIGNKTWHGRGVAVEVVAATKNFHVNVKEVYLVVNYKNIMAIDAYVKCGFKKCNIKNLNIPTNESIVMKLVT
jgi:RimJ/RimL family protein N-acetyltransferase